MILGKLTASVLGYFADTDAATAAMQPFMKTINDHIVRWWGSALDPHTDMYVVGQGADDSVVALAEPGACASGDLMDYKAFWPVYSTKLEDSYGLPVPGSLQPAAPGDPVEAGDRVSRRRLRSGSYVVSGVLIPNAPS